MVFISVTNSGTGAADGTVKITFTDGDTVDYALKVSNSLSIMQSAGGTQTADGTIKVSEANGANLFGWISLLTEGSASPPSVAPFSGTAFCTTV